MGYDVEKFRYQYIWILENYKYLLDNFNFRVFFLKKKHLSKHLTFLHFRLPFLMKFKTKFFREIIYNGFFFKNGKQCYKFIVLGHE